jgi:hypothetical protein
MMFGQRVGGGQAAADAPEASGLARAAGGFMARLHTGGANRVLKGAQPKRLPPCEFRTRAFSPSRSQLFARLLRLCGHAGLQQLPSSRPHVEATAHLPMWARTSCLSALLIATIASSPLHAQSQTVTVGPAPGCTSTTLAGALASLPRLGPGVVHRIRVMGGSLITGGATVDRLSVRIEGGHTSCTSTVPQQGVLSRISGTTSIPLLRLRNVIEPGAEYRIELRNLEFRDGPAGAIEVEGRVALRLDAVELTNNRATTGAGLRVLGRPAGWTLGAVVSFGDGVVINANEAVGGDGGGVHCTAGGVLRPEGSGSVFVINNVAGGRGGGLYLNNCGLAQPPGGLPGVRIANNRAAGGGGAALIDSEGVIDGAGMEIENNTAAGAGDGGGLLLQRSALRVMAPLRLAGNRAGGSGGGAWIDSGQVLIDAAKVPGVPVGPSARWVMQGNSAFVGGGGLHVEGDSLLETSHSSGCGVEPCVRVDDNQVTGVGTNLGIGGALFVGGNSVIAWDRLQVRGNRAESAAVLFASSGSPPMGVRIEWANLAMSGNSSAWCCNGFAWQGAPVVLGRGVRLSVRLASVADNEARGAGSFVPQVFHLTAEGAALDLRGVVIDQPGWQTLGHPHAAQIGASGACVISREVASLTARGVPAVAVDPRLDATLRLRADSPAIDACTDADLEDPEAMLGLMPLLHDIDAARRPVRVRNSTGGRDYDAGAREYSVLLFRSGFEGDS